MEQSEIEQLCEEELFCEDRIRDWLCERVAPTEIPRWWQICVLVARNQGWEVHGWGVMSNGGIFGTGLEMEDALTLMQYKAFIDGIEWGGGAVHAALVPVFKEFIRIHEKLAEGTHE